MADISSWDLSVIKRDAIKSQRECSQRGLFHSAKWAAELSFAIDEFDPERMADISIDAVNNQEYTQESERFTLAKSYFDLQEYSRAAHFLQNSKCPKSCFLYFYSLYQAGGKKALDDAPDSLGTHDNTDNEYLKDLRSDLGRRHKTGELDGYSLYLYGVVLKKLDLTREALGVLVEAISKENLHWGAWQELSLIITDKDMTNGYRCGKEVHPVHEIVNTFHYLLTDLSSLSLPDVWMKQFFLGQTFLELQLNEEALKIYHSLTEHGFSKSTYVMAQTALVYHNTKDVDAAVKSFSELQKHDPYRLENMDIYSNLLYVKDMRVELAHLAHHCCDIDKYKVETCCVIGNYYSLRGQHEKAVLYFQRALKLNPHYLCAWTLMGHEYMELKNTNAAIQAYRIAIEVNRRDYRAWYGLGQTYEILKMHTYCLYYYMKAQVLRPNDSRMVMALGEVYEKLDRLNEAKKCFWKAHSLGDVEGLALIRLAKLFEKLDEEDQAAAAYTEYLNESDRKGMYNIEEQSQAYRFLANYHLKRGNLEDAYFAAQKCTEFDETKEEGKALLKEIPRWKFGDDGEMPNRAGPVLNDPGSVTSERDISMSGGFSTPILRLTPVNLFATHLNKD